MRDKNRAQNIITGIKKRGISKNTSLKYSLIELLRHETQVRIDYRKIFCIHSKKR